MAIPEANPVFEAPAQFSIDGLTEKVVTIFVTFIFSLFALFLVASVQVLKRGRSEKSNQKTCLLCECAEAY